MDDTDPLAKTGISSVKVISGEELICDGVTFKWWAVGDRPTLVTVQSPDLGSLRDFTEGDSKEFAMSLARKLLRNGN